MTKPCLRFITNDCPKWLGKTRKAAFGEVKIPYGLLNLTKPRGRLKMSATSFVKTSVMGLAKMKITATP